MVGQIWTSNSGTPELPVKRQQKKNLIKEGPGALGSVATFKPGPLGALSYEHKQPFIGERED